MPAPAATMAGLRALVQPMGTGGTKTEQKTPVLAKPDCCRSHTRLTRLQVQQIDLLVHKGKKGTFPTMLLLSITLQALHLAIHGPFSELVQLTNPQRNQPLLFAESVCSGCASKAKRSNGLRAKKEKDIIKSL